MQSISQRFWKKVKIEDLLGCWAWQGALGTHGYGHFWIDGKAVLAHRFAYSISKQCPIPDSKLILHTCDNKKCVNPNHLYPGTRIDNARDAIARGQQLRGELCPAAKLTAKQVLRIRKAIDRGESTRRLSKRFGVTISNISKIKRRQLWSHLP